MKTKITTIICATVLSTTMFAQDIITLKNGNELKVKVLEVAPTEIKYKKFDNPEGPTYTDLKSNIFMIKYESGLKDVFSDQASKATPVVETPKTINKEAGENEYVNIDLNSPYKNFDLILTNKGDSIKCVIDQISTNMIYYHILRPGADNRAYIYMTSVLKYFNNPDIQSNTTLANNTTTQVVPKTSNPDDDEFIPESRKYGGPRIGVTFIDGGAFRNALVSEGKRNVYSQFGWQFEKRLFTTKTGISSMIELVPTIGGIDMGKFIPSISGLLGVRMKNGIEFGAGPNIGFYGARDATGVLHTSSSVGVVIAAGMSLKSDNVYFPINIVFIPSVGKKTTYTDPNTLQKVSKTYQTGAKISLLVGFNYRKK